MAGGTARAQELILKTGSNVQSFSFDSFFATTGHGQGFTFKAEGEDEDEQERYVYDICSGGVS